MANTDFANGFIPSRHLKGGVIRASEKLIASGYAADIFSGQAVKLTTDGVIEVLAAAETNGIGMFCGVEWTAVDGEYKFSRYWPSGTVTKGAAPAKAYVYEDPDIAFVVQTVTGTTFAQAMVGGNSDLVGVAGNAATGQSTSELNIGTVVATTAQFRILGLVPRADNALGEHADVEVMWVEHLNRPAGTVGI